MKFIELCNYYTELEGKLTTPEWDKVWQVVRLSNHALSFIRRLKELGISEEIINKANEE